MSFTIRPFAYSESDLVAINKIFNAHYPEYAESLEMTRYKDETRDATYFFHRDIIERDGNPVAEGIVKQSAWSFHPQKYYWRVNAYPTYDRYALNDLHFAHTLKHTLAHKEIIAINASAREDEAEQLRFLKDQGFTETMRYQESALHLPDFDAGMFKGTIEAVRDAGIEIFDLNEMQQRERDDWQQVLYALCAELYQQSPTPDPSQQMSFDTFVKMDLEAPTFIAAGWFVAKVGDHYVGVTNLEKQSKHTDKLKTGFTGVRPEYRRQHIATALKVRALQFAQQSGVMTIETDNEANNPMYQINVQLGFKPKPAWIDFEKAL